MVSVVMPYYQAAAWVGRAVQSVLDQNYPELELWVVDDGSPDRPALEQVMAELASHPRAGRLQVLHQANRGPSAARNAGVAAARGPLIAFLDADDWWDPEMLVRAVDALEAHGGADLAAIDGWLELDNSQPAVRITERSPCAETPTVCDVLDGSSTLITSGVVMRRAVFEAAGGFDETLWRSEDFDLWIRLLRAGARVRHVAAPAIHRRIVGTGLAANAAVMCEAAEAVLARHLADPKLHGAARAAAERGRRRFLRQRHVMLCRQALGEGLPVPARAHAIAALRLRPSIKLLLTLVGLTVAAGPFSRGFRERQ